MKILCRFVTCIKINKLTSIKVWRVFFFFVSDFTNYSNDCVACSRRIHKHIFTLITCRSLLSDKHHRLYSDCKYFNRTSSSNNNNNNEKTVYKHSLLNIMRHTIKEEQKSRSHHELKIAKKNNNNKNKNNNNNNNHEFWMRKAMKIITAEPKQKQRA